MVGLVGGGSAFALTFTSAVAIAISIISIGVVRSTASGDAKVDEEQAIHLRHSYRHQTVVFVFKVAQSFNLSGFL